MAAVDSFFLDYSANKLRQLTERIETCLARLTPEQVWMRGSENENAIGNLVLHLAGNVRQWIVSGVGGKPDTRDRDGEFAARGGLSVPQLTARLRDTVVQAVAVLETVAPERLEDALVIQGYAVSRLEAVYHVVEHFSMHTGQIIFATKILTGADLGFYCHLQSAAAHGEPTP
jgi:uncharacterized damage-inducible protein DinB